ncbi:MAG: MarR family transcriptional regulator [Archaeoglobi archaeon]|nr:MarR family transcriptional regulator [Archaeoglobi archaeon]
MDSSDALLLLTGIGLLVFSFTLAPSSHHYMMMGPYYLGILPSITAIAGIVLIAVPLIKRASESRVAEHPDIIKSDELESEAGNGVPEKIEVAERVLDGDERTLFRLIYENEGITQDSLHFRTGFSHSKISMLVKKLEERGLIYRERFGKTYRIYLSDWLKE